MSQSNVELLFIVQYMHHAMHFPHQEATIAGGNVQLDIGGTST